MKKRVLAWFAVVLLAIAVCAPAFASGVVQPDSELFYVYDGADVIGDDTTATIVLNNDTLYDACGAQIVIVALNTTGNTQIEDYAYELFDTWGIGSADKNNGLLLLMAIGDDDYWYLQGKGLQNTFPVAELSAIADRYLEPYFAKKDYDTGALKFFEQVYAKVASIYGVSTKVTSYKAQDLYGDPQGGYTEGPQGGYTDGPNGGQEPERGRGEEEPGVFSTIVGLIFFILLISLAVGAIRKLFAKIGGRPTVGMSWFWFRPWRIFRPRTVYTTPPPAPGPAPRPAPRPSGFAPRPTGRTWGTTGSRSTGSSWSSGSRSTGSSWSSGSSRSSSGSSSSRSSFGGGRSSSSVSRSVSRSGGGGSSRGGGGGRHR